MKEEVEIHLRLNHKHIIQFLGIFCDENYVYIVLEYAPNGELFTKLRKQRRFDSETTKKYLRQIIDSLIYLQKMGVMHRDIKPENILLDINEDSKLCDFGWAARIHSEEDRRKTLCGTLDYLPPEMLCKEWYDNTCEL